jgi:hypothetical protein
MPGPPDHSTATKLPPPPAPVARDANPWPMPQRQGETRVRAERPRRAKYPLPPPLDPIRSSRHGLSRFLPIAVFLVILGSVASGALKALGRGDRLGAIIPLIVLGVAAVSVWRSARRRSNRSLGIPGVGEGDR